MQSVAEYLAILLTAGCALAATLLLIAAWRGRSILRFPRGMNYMESAAHVHVALVLFILPLHLYEHQLGWAFPAFAIPILVGCMVHGCVLERREQRRQRSSGPSSAFDEEAPR